MGVSLHLKMEFSEEELGASGLGQPDDDQTTFYWGKMKTGVLNYPARLQTQCLLHLVGYNNDYNTTSLGLLPSFIRVQLLLLLPALDVVKLEGTPVTAGLSMSEIWETIFKERLPLHTCWSTGDIDENIGSVFIRPGDLERKGVQNASWKEVYFTTVFVFAVYYARGFFNFKDEDYCKCQYPHFIHDLLYCCGVSNTDVSQCFSFEKTGSVHGVYRCAEKCSCLTTKEYYQLFAPVVTNPSSRGFGDISICELVTILINDCHFFIRYLRLTEELYNFVLPFMNDTDFFEKLSIFLGVLESISISPFISPGGVDFLVKLLDMIMDWKCPIKCINAYGHFNEVLPYLSNASHGHNLKKLGLSIGIDEDADPPSTALCLLESSESVDTSMMVIDVSLTNSIEEILELHQDLEKFEFRFDSFYKEDYTSDTVLINGELFHLLKNLMYRPLFMHLSIDVKYIGHDISHDVVVDLFRHFFSSSYPVTMNLSLTCLQFQDHLDTLTFNPQLPLKSLELHHCSLSQSFSRLLPHNFALKSLTISNDYEHEYQISYLFADLESVKVDKVTISYVNIDQSNIEDICSLLHVIDSKEWSLSVIIKEENIFDRFLSSLSKVAHNIQHFELRDYELDQKMVVAILELLFTSLSRTKMPYFELGFSNYLFDDELVKLMHVTWKKCGAIRLKTINIDASEKNKYGIDIENILSDMAVEYCYQIK